MTNWRPEHGKTIYAFLEYLNNKSEDFILKGGTALLTCYKLDRFSEDIDLDGKRKNLEDFVKGFCEKTGTSYRVAKDTDTVKRYMINYGNTGRPLKVEVSFRRREIATNEITLINGIRVYNLDTLCIMKTNAYTSRDKIRDLYDLTFICNNYYDHLSPQTISLLRSAIEYKGIEQFDYIIKEQHDELIDEGKLADDFLSMFDRLGLLYDEKEKQILSSIEKKNNIVTPTLIEQKSSMKERMAAAQVEADRRSQSGNQQHSPFLHKNKSQPEH